MHITNLRKVGGSVMTALPPALLDLLNIRAGAKVGIVLDNGRLIVEPHPRSQYSLEALLAQCKANDNQPDPNQGWLSDGPVGDELI